MRRRTVLIALAAAPLLISEQTEAAPETSKTPHPDPVCDRCGHVWWGSGDSFQSTVEPTVPGPGGWSQTELRYGTLCQECSRGTPAEREAACCSACGVKPVAYFSRAPHSYWGSYWDVNDENHFYWEGGYTHPDQRCGNCARARLEENRKAGDAWLREHGYQPSSA